MIAVGHQVNQQGRGRYRIFFFFLEHHSELRNIFLRYSAAACLSAASAFGLLIKSYDKKNQSLHLEPTEKDPQKPFRSYSCYSGFSPALSSHSIL